MFYGKNKEKSTMVLASDRAKYQLMSHPENGGLGLPMIKDLNFAEMNYYGRINPVGRSIYPMFSKMEQLRGDPAGGAGMKFALYFVSKMFDQVKDNIQTKMGIGALPNKNPWIKNMNPVRAYESPDAKYQSYLNETLAHFNMFFLDEIGYENVLNFNDYVKYLQIYFKEGFVGVPITFSGWNISSLNSIFGSGLAVSIAPMNFDDDEPKGAFLDSVMYPYFRNLVMNHGFSLVHNCPWVMVADIGSPAFQKYKNDIDKGKINKLFINNYKFTSNIDIQLLMNSIINYYNDFVLVNESERLFIHSCNKVKTNYYYRERVEEGKYNDPKMWLDMYVDFRNIENRHVIDDYDLVKIKRNAKKLANKFDISRATRYIDLRVSKFYWKKSGGFADLMRKYKARKKYKLQQKLKGNTDSTKSMITGGGSSGGY